MTVLQDQLELSIEDVVFTSHAHRRCAEMGVPLSVVRQIIADSDRTWPGHKTTKGSDTLMRVSDRYPHYTVCTTVEAGRLYVVSLLFNSSQPYLRDGRGYIVVATGERVACIEDDTPARMPQQALAAVRRVAMASQRRRLVVDLDAAHDMTEIAQALREKADELEQLAGLGYRLTGSAGQLVMDVKTG